MFNQKQKRLNKIKIYVKKVLKSLKINEIKFKKKSHR
jgi:hypothetical protein